MLAIVGRWLRGRGARDADRVAAEVSDPVILTGPWSAGVALAWYSSESGAGRTAVADLFDRFKYAGERSLAEVLGQSLARELAFRQGFEAVEAIVHMPASTRRERWEPTCDLARVLAGALGVRCFPRLMVATRALSPQKDVVSWEDKQGNVRGAFRLRRPLLVRGRKVLLLDDVYDSGATLEEGWRVLAEAGAREVVVATVTKTRYRRGA